MATKKAKLKKKQHLRNNEYYSIQSEFDRLYSQSKENKKFKNLLELIISDENILLAYRNIKKNKGSKTRGTNRTTIIEIGQTEPQKLISYVRGRLSNFKPQSVRRVEIEKENGKLRPLGIPTIEDRLIQQCIKQVLEPICEAKFYKHSYGFRSNRSTHHAIARTLALTNRHNFQYVVDIDIKGFFDNVNHAKLLKQLWTLGIQDKNLLSIISKMLKAEIKGIGIPEKGVPQGGILSPLLSNVVLNELDWWIASQWEEMPTRYQYSIHKKSRALHDNSNLKECYIVRYADDFKLFCKDRKTAVKMFEATKAWLLERLGLEISPEKSKIVNFKKKYSEFLGIKMKLWKKADKFVIKSHISEKSMKKCKKKLKDKIKAFSGVPTIDNISAFNAAILGLHNYYKAATHVSKNFSDISYEVRKSLKCRVRDLLTKSGLKSKAYIRFYGGFKGKTIYIKKIAIFPISFVKTKPPMCFSQKICNYTAEGRKLIHDKLQAIDLSILDYLLRNPKLQESTEYNDNRISLYVGQRGKCFVSGERLCVYKMEVHHKAPKSLNGRDEYGNLVFITAEIHKSVHMTDIEAVQSSLQKLKLDNNALNKLNQLRKLVGNCEIV